MNLFINKLIPAIPSLSPPTSYQERSYSSYLLGPEKDIFVKSQSVSPSFCANGSNKSTSAGNRLKELDNITCPYSGVKMISGKKMDKIEAKLANCNNIKERMEVLEPYRPCMQKLEKQVYNIFKGYEINHPHGTMNRCLQELKPECLAQLRIDELKVLDEVDKLSNKMDAHSALKVRKITINARKKIVEDKQDQIFKRKDLLTDLYSVTKDYPDQDTIAKIWEVANKLPKSTTNLNAFVVKYANRSPQEIATRLLKPSVASIEHITPASLRGKNHLTNFMLTSRDWNSDRSSTPLPEYINDHPNIPKYTQRYANDIIKAIQKGKLKECDWYPYVLKEKLYNESAGIIDIDLAKYKINEEDAFKDAPEDVVQIYNDLKTANTAIE